LERICAEVPRQGHLDSAGLAGAIRLLEGGRLALAVGIPNAQGTYDYKQPGFFLPSDGPSRFRPRIKSGAGSCRRLVLVSVYIYTHRVHPDTLLIEIYGADLAVYEKDAPSN
jgi:hypothetical protein